MRKVACATFDEVDVECTHCKVSMTAHRALGSAVQYFHCASCHRWVTSTYSEVFRADAKVRAHRRADRAGNPTLNQVKERLTRWLHALDDQDPYRTLGASPLDPDEAIRDRYLKLARAHHPDRGGSPDEMRRVNEAYERIVAHRERQAASALATARQLPTGA